MCQMLLRNEVGQEQRRALDLAVPEEWWVMKLNWNKLRRESVLMKERERLLMGENTSRQRNY